MSQPGTSSLLRTRRPSVCLAQCGGARLYVTGGSNTNDLSRRSYNHPLAPENPANRNVALPGAFYKQYGGGEMARTAEELKKRAERALLLQMQQDVLWEGTVITSLDHHLVKHFVELSKNPKYRASQNLTVVGGKELIREIGESGVSPKHLLVTEGKEVPEWMRDHPNTEIITVSRTVSEQCSPGNDGFVGDFEIPPAPPKEALIANKQRMDRVLVLDNVDDHGVLGTLLRTAVGFQYDAVIVTNHCADIYDNRVIRAARGAHFQSGVPIYTLRDEDGDSTFSMLNHVADRNELLPVCVPGQEDSPDAPFTNGRSVVAGLRSPPPTLPTSKPKKKSLEDFCLDRFAKGNKEERGYILFAGPNHKQNLVKKLSSKMKRPPVQLLVDGLPTDCDLLMTLPVVMHALRPFGEWDYLPLDKKHEASSMELQTRRASVDLGPNRLSVSEKDLNLDEEEQIKLSNELNAFKKWKRLRAKQMSDYDMWMTAEEQRVNSMLKNTRQRITEPWKEDSPVREDPGAKGMPEWVPNIVDEYRQNLDRDSLAHEREISEDYKRPYNYSK